MALSITKICDIAKDELKTLPNEHGYGVFLLINTRHKDNLRKCAIALAKVLSEKDPLPIYLVRGYIRKQRGQQIAKQKPRTHLRLQMDGKVVEEPTSGLSFPEDRPIIVLVEYFDCLELARQWVFCQMVNGEQGEFALHSGSVLIGGLLPSPRGELEIFDWGDFYELAVEE